jgi:ATP-dependent Clp protease ATP-binding subunit ClpB
LQRELETRIGRSLVAGEIADGAKITIALEKGALTIRHDNVSAGRKSG